jgi:hypothetical protein
MLSSKYVEDAKTFPLYFVISSLLPVESVHLYSVLPPNNGYPDAPTLPQLPIKLPSTPLQSSLHLYRPYLELPETVPEPSQ